MHWRGLGVPTGSKLASTMARRRSVQGQSDVMVVLMKEVVAVSYK